MRLMLPLAIDTWPRIRDLRRASAPRGKPVAVALPEAGPGLWHVVAVGEVRLDGCLELDVIPASEVRAAVPG